MWCDGLCKLFRYVIVLIHLLTYLQQISTSINAGHSSKTFLATTGGDIFTDNTTEVNVNGSSVYTSAFLTPTISTAKEEIPSISSCPDNLECSKLGGECIRCTFNKYCKYGSVQKVGCIRRENISCIPPIQFQREYQCRYCYQLDPQNYTCNASTSCKVVSSPRTTYIALCTVKSEILCMGRRQFYKSLPCNWTGGYKWSTALLLSITLGGFGVDRFYLGMWREGIGKLFSFGGLGVWTLVDVILIAVGYVGPADGSLYI